MSQHRHHTTTPDGKRFTVTMGYDRPLDYVFCTVVQDGQDGIVYSNLSDDDAGTELQDVNYFRHVLSGLELQVPESLFSEVATDQRWRVGNKSVDHV